MNRLPVSVVHVFVYELISGDHCDFSGVFMNHFTGIFGRKFVHVIGLNYSLDSFANAPPYGLPAPTGTQQCVRLHSEAAGTSSTSMYF